MESKRDPVINDAIEMTKLNKELVERTNVTIKYADQTTYVAGEEKNLVLKVNNVSN